MPFSILSFIPFPLHCLRMFAGLLILFLFSVSLPAEQSVTTEVLLLTQRQLGPETLKLLREAKKNIRLCLPLWQFSKQSQTITRRLLKELLLQAKKGLDVEVILDQGPKGMPDPSAAVRQILFSAGVKVFEDSKTQTTRCSMLLVDDFTCVTGSFDWTEISLQQNVELALWIESVPFYKTLRQRFEEIKTLGAN